VSLLAFSEACLLMCPSVVVLLCVLVPMAQVRGERPAAHLGVSIACRKHFGGGSTAAVWKYCDSMVLAAGGCTVRILQALAAGAAELGNQRSRAVCMAWMCCKGGALSFAVQAART
jgi:hypothetical protein